MGQQLDLFDEDKEPEFFPQTDVSLESFSNDNAQKYPLTPKECWKLNTGQQNALDFFVPFCLGNSEFYRALLMGYAGTGKTFTMNRVVERVRQVNPKIIFGMTAPTHKAVRQLYKHSELKDQLDFGTIHSFLGLKQVLKKHPKKPNEMIETFEPDKGMMGRRKIDEINVLIIDESSMLSDELYEHIDDIVRTGRLRVIFMGDGLQIPPVGKKQDTGLADAIPFVAAQRHSRKIHLVELTEIVRQGAGNPIIEYSMAIRQQYKHQNIDCEFSHTEDSGVEIIRKERPELGDESSGLPRLRNLFKQYFCTPEFKEDPDYMKVVVWRNSTADYFNREIRLLIYEAETLPKIVNNDKLVLDKPYFIKKFMIPNSEEIIVLSHEIVEKPYKYHIYDHGNKNQFQKATEDASLNDLVGRKEYSQYFKVYRCKVVLMSGEEQTVDILHEDSESDYNDIRERMVKSAKDRTTEFFEQKEMWKQYYDMEKAFCWTKHNYCLTAHKSQGSTYDYCVSMEWDINTNYDIEERNRIRYVAATRARNKLYIVK